MKRSPINIKEIAKKGILDEKRFYTLLSEQNNYVDNATTKDFYMGFVRFLTSELRKNGIIRLPHLGDFALVKQKDRIALAGKTTRMLTGKYILKFIPAQKWKIYFTKLEERSGAEGRLDPREKVLGRILE